MAGTTDWEQSLLALAEVLLQVCGSLCTGGGGTSCGPPLPIQPESISINSTGIIVFIAVTSDLNTLLSICPERFQHCPIDA
jgi:hypothetical protein